ncbi:MAG: hypothetical protein JSU77_01310 [Fidelibacterota bacterium]|nr:MAG: hypothetical protein JSU77_01310 [Candidatus Neomarinimicrobiota bacterium]
MTERRFLDEVDEEEQEDQEEEPEEQPKPSKETGTGWAQWLHIAASLAAVTAISLLTLEMAVGPIKLGKLAAYALGSSLLIGILLILVIIYKYALSKIRTGIWRYAFWFISVPIAFLYYLLFVYLIYGQFAPLLVRMMGAAMANAP